MNITLVTKHLDEDNTVWYMSVIDGQNMSVPLDPANRHFSAIMKAVEEGTLVIQEADPT